MDLFTLCELFFTAKDTLPRLLVEAYRGHLLATSQATAAHLPGPVAHGHCRGTLLYQSAVVLVRPDMQHRLLWLPDLQIQGYCSTLGFPGVATATGTGPQGPRWLLMDIRLVNRRPL